MKTSSCNELAQGIQNVFIKSFSDSVFRRKYEECYKIAEKILIKK